MCTDSRLTDEKVVEDILVDLEEEASDSRTRATPTRPYAGSGPVSSFGGARICRVVENCARNWWVALDRMGNARRMIVAIVNTVEVLGRSGSSRC